MESGWVGVGINSELLKIDILSSQIVIKSNTLYNVICMQ